MESWITIEVRTIKIQSAQLFLSVLIQFLTSNDWDARITICLCPDCWRACLGAQFRLIQLNKFRICSKIKWFGLMYTTYKLITISHSIFKIRLHFNALSNTGDGVFGFFTVPGGNPFFFSNVPTLQSLLVFLILYLRFPLSLFLTSCSLLSLLLIDNSSIINSIREIHVLHEDLNIDNLHV